MNPDDKAKAAKLYECHRIVGATSALSAERVTQYLRLLADVPPDRFAAAVDAHLNDPEASRYRPFPLPADLRAKLPRPGSAHLPADAAWALALQASDEAETVIWTQEIAEALEGARPVLDAGDQVGARMAFRALYERLTANAAPPVYRVSVGHDPAKRVAVLDQAQRLGLLTREQAARHLPAPEASGAGTAVAGLLGNVLAFPGKPRPDPAEKWAELRALLKARIEADPTPTPAVVGPEEMAAAYRRLEAARAARAAEAGRDAPPAPHAARGDA